MIHKKLFSILALLCLAVSGAWADGYYLVGNMNSWTVNSQYKLVANPGNDAEMMITLYFNQADEFKVVYSADDAATTTWYPDGTDNNYNVNTEGRYTVYFRADGQGGDDWHYKCIYLAWDPIKPTATENQNEWTFTMPAYDVQVNVEYETALALSEADDNTTTLAEWDGYEADVTLARTLQAGGWNTLAVPFGISTANFTALQTMLAAQGGSISLKQLSSSSLENGTLTLTFADANSIEAGKPYLVKVSKALNLATLPATIAALGGTNPFAGVEVSKAPATVETTVADFIPTLGKTLVTGPAGDESNAKAVLFLNQGTKLANPTVVGDQEQEACYMKGFRAYFQLKGDAVNARNFSLNLGDETTGIQSVDSGKLTVDSYFNLAGQRVTQPTKGLYIVNGKKVIK